MKFRNKILIAICGIVLGLILITFGFINYWVRDRVQAKFVDDLKANSAVVHEINSLRAEQDIKSCQIIAETPRLKAVAELRDQNTALQLSKELNFSALSNLFILTDARGNPAARLIDGKESEIPLAGFHSIHQALNNHPEADAWNIGPEVFRGASCPIRVGADLVGTLTVGFRIQEGDLASVKNMTNSEVVLTADTPQVFSTLPHAEIKQLTELLDREGMMYLPFQSQEPGKVFTFEGQKESYVATVCRLDRGEAIGRRGISYLLLKPMAREVRAALTPVVNTFLLLSIVALFFTAVTGYIISRSITRPIAAIVEGTKEVSRGNYDVHIEVQSRGELKYLAQKFEEMGLGLKEKVSQLALRNVELEKAFKELKETQEDRLRLTANLQLLLESTDQGIFGVDLEGNCSFINKAAARMLGFSQGDVVGRHLHELVHHSHPDGSPYRFDECPVSLVLRSGRGCRIDNEVFWREGKKPFPVEYSSYPIVDGGTVAGAVVTFGDITERKLLERQLIQAQKIEGIGTLAAGIAHDFNNILGIVLGHASILERAAFDRAKLQRSTQAIREAGKRGAGLVKQILTFARKTETRFEAVSVDGIVEDLMKMVSETFPKTITFSVKLTRDMPSIIADPNQLHQALLNLCVNARDAMSNGGTLSIRTEILSGQSLRERFPEARQIDYVCVRVSDTGVGMDETIRSHIFEPFFTTKERGRGTGLGLAVVYGIAKGHYGFIDVESKRGYGTTFSLFFPVEMKGLDSLKVGRREEDREIPGGNETILFVEDEEMLLDLLGAALKERGYKLLTAKDGEQAIEMYTLHQDEIALALVDIGLPKLSGWEAFQRMKRINPNVKVILASGYLEPHLKSEMLKAGAKAFIQKPYIPNDILKWAREVIDRSN